MRQRTGVAIAAMIMSVLSGVAMTATAGASTGPLPIKPGPGGAVREPAPVGPKIVGGKPVTNGAYKFQAALLAQSFGSNDFLRQYCGGSLITPTDVLTAAHCVEFIGNKPGQVPMSDLRVVVGRTVLTTNQGQKRTVASISIHPKYSPITFSNDVAVIRLSAPVNGIRPVLLVTPGTDALERPGLEATVTGWGNLIAQPAGPGGGGIKYPDRLQEGKVPLVSRVECATAYASIKAKIDNTMTCAGRTDRDTCQGDSGGPMFFRATGSPGYIQVGITSWGEGCGATGFPGVYTRLGNTSVGNFVIKAVNS